MNSDQISELNIKGSEICQHLSQLIKGDCCVLDTDDTSIGCTIHAEHHFCEQCTSKFCNKRQTLSYGMKEARRWQGKYVFYCPIGFTFVVAAIPECSHSFNGMLTSSKSPNPDIIENDTDINARDHLTCLAAGPIILGDPNDTLHDFPYPEMFDKIAKLPVMSSDEVRHLAELMKMLTISCCSDISLKRTGDAFYEQNQQSFLNALYEVEDKYKEANSTKSAKSTESASSPYSPANAQASVSNTYSLADEQRFLDSIRDGDKQAAQAALNNLLGNIFFYSDFKLDTIKTRMIELITLLSREAIACGADISDMFRNNTSYIHQIENISSIDEISSWTAGIMHRFIHTVFDFSKVKHADIVHKTSNYIRENYNSKLTLEILSKEVGLSSAYLSSVFKQETGVSISNYINKIRVENSKTLLKNTTLTLSFIANECCFETQSYFTKVFKSFAGMTPKQYRLKLQKN